jgi:hypothetical protein
MFFYKNVNKNERQESRPSHLSPFISWPFATFTETVIQRLVRYSVTVLQFKSKQSKKSKVKSISIYLYI